VSLILRIVRGGVAAALVAGAAGYALERLRFGPSAQTALDRVHAEIRDRFDRSAGSLGAIASTVAAARDAMSAAPRDQTAIMRLFDLTASVVPAADGRRTGVTIYDAAGAPIAWAGRVSDVPKERVQGPAALLIAPSALGPRLIRVEPVAATAARSATVVVEQSLGLTEEAPGPVDTFVMQTTIAPVTLRVGAAGPTPAAGPFQFVVSSRDSAFALEAEVAPADLAAARARWRAAVWSVVLGVIALTMLLCTGPVIEMRRRTRETSQFLRLTAALVVIVVAARVVSYIALTPATEPSEPTPLDLFLTTVTLTAVVWLVLDLVERRRTARPRLPLLAPTSASLAAAGGAYAAAGLATAWLLWGYEGLLRRVVAQTNFDLLHFSLHPLSAGRLTIEFALVLLHAAVIWGAVAILRLPSALWRVQRARMWQATSVFGWLAGAVGGTIAARAVWPPVPLAPLWTALVAAALAAIVLSRLGGRMRRMSPSTRLAIFFAALLAPAMAMYPSLLAHVTAAKEGLVADEFGPQAASLREDLQRRLQRAVEQIDAMPSLAEFVTGASGDTPSTDPATIVWSRTDLATYRLTSAVELYDPGGQLVSRFALSLPEYAETTNRASRCTWEEPFEEVSPFGSSERHVLRTTRGVCADGRIVGSVVVRVMLDYRTLPFISSLSPYLESLRPHRQPPAEGASGRDVEFAVYGWTRAPIFESGTRVWTLDDAIFQRLIASREPLWADVVRDGETFRVYFMSDRGAIYALGYPIIDTKRHLMNLAELVMLVGVLYVIARLALTFASLLTLRTPATGRALLREIRSSFYRKLFLAFWAGAVVPVFILALVTRAYVQTQLIATAEEAAARTVTTAQRLVEDYAALQQRGAAALDTVDDQIMVLVRRAIDEDVNLFNRARLQATSARDLFASQLLSLRTPADIYRSILLDRLPTYVREEVVGTFRYSLAAAPVRSSGREGIVTVALTNRQQQIEQQIDELDRLVLTGFVLFSLLGAALGYWMAERIADPVSRLTRATRRIARGDLDARIAATSTDELRRLVEDFNQMAADLKRQRAELERTQRLEAWADMARQVAHDIKNPLTPIQLSAEHAQRVNVDRGRPLSPVLDECVNAILNQVKLLRQLSAEFSSFASSPTPRPEPTAVPALIDEVVEPYRTGLANRVRIDLRAQPDLPPAAIDRTLFARALTNIIENALHAMPGGGTLTVVSRKSQVGSQRSQVGSRRSQVGSQHSQAGSPKSSVAGQPSADGHLVVEITDTGVGMDQEALSKIFEPYFSTKASGTGLGLTIARRNVELIGGTIDVRSQRGVGTTVTITLPLG
jgi:signal transduction histidine kinase